MQPAEERMTTTIAVTGASGQLGYKIVEILAANTAVQTIALVRNPAKKTFASNVEVRKFDYSDNASALTAALSGVSAVILISSNNVGSRFTEHKAVIDAAVSAGVKTVLYTSILNAETTVLKLASEHKQTEEYLAAQSSLKHVFLRNSWYTENWTESIGGVLASSAVLGASKDAQFSLATRNDYARASAAAAVRSVTGVGALKEIYELGGVPVRPSEYAAEISKHAGRTIVYKNFPEAEYVALLTSFGLPATFAEILADSDVGAAVGGLYVETTDLVDLIGGQPEDWKVYVKEAVAHPPTAQSH
ncbi:hypothetical protein HK100_000762 [Physocladia obscura]|uniref:NmrA-like domain-containing protein n=1 Tax=Physocladia obscura TaxID=109957 RepID=A0AAD5SY45_9FUNG|nr:hypothetical protein HK100_000762 [Physocladia obscura]